MQTQAKAFTAKQLKEVVSKAETKQIQKLKKEMPIEETLNHIKRFKAIEQQLLDESYSKALEGKNTHSINVTAFFQEDTAANIPLILIQLKCLLSLLGYKITLDSIFSHVTLQSYDILQIEW